MKKLPVILIGLMASLAIGVSTARGQQSYSLEDLGVVKEMEYSQAAAINNQGNVAGTAYKGERDMCLPLRLQVHVGCRRLQQPRIRYQLHEHGSGGRLPGRSNATDKPRYHIQWRSREGSRGFERPAIQPSQWHQRHGASGWILRSRARQRTRVAPSCGADKPAWWTLARWVAHMHRRMRSTTLGSSPARPKPGQRSHVTTHAFIIGGRSAVRRTSEWRLGCLGGHSSYGMAINGYNHIAGYSTIKTNDARVHAFLHNGTR